MSEVTRILSELEQGDPQAAETLLPLVYDALRKLAAARLAHEKPGQTLQATALVHEAYLRLLGPAGLEKTKHQCATDSRAASSPVGRTYLGHGHFFAAAAEAMRRILVERARRRGRLKHGGEMVRVELDDVDISVDTDGIDLLDLDSVLARLAAEHPEKAELVKLRYFAGLSGDEAAAVLGVSPATADRYWTYARAWLFRELSDSEPDQ